MERDEAAKSGLTFKSIDDYPWKELLKEANGDYALMAGMRMQRIFSDLGIKQGRVGVYGHTDLSAGYSTLTHLQKLMPDLTIVGESLNDSIFLRAMETKDDGEVSRIRKVGKITTEVVGKVADYLTSCNVREDEILLTVDGSPLTVGNIKAKINLWLAERGAENPDGTIFSIGHDTGVPHSSGNPDDVICLGRTIIFDIFPCEAGGGYFYDFTRTWSLGYATTETRKLYQQVYEVFDQVKKNLKVNEPFKNSQVLACELFEAQGHLSLLNSENPLKGYVHSLGHGLGLNVHERPWSSLIATDDNLLSPGVVVTIEPGLYYPDQNMGARIEDTLWIRPDGEIEILAEYPYEFILPMKKWHK
jgi:Xaa-Pro aminopeptidase